MTLYKVQTKPWLNDFCASRNVLNHVNGVQKKTLLSHILKYDICIETVTRDLFQEEAGLQCFELRRLSKMMLYQQMQSAELNIAIL